jgi:hypothetical protein
MSLVQDEDMIHALAADRADHPLDKRILPGRVWGDPGTSVRCRACRPQRRVFPFEETTLTTIDSFYQSTGTSPPSAGADSPMPSAPSDTPAMPEELIETLATLLADALIADIRQYPNLAELPANRESTVESPSGLNRRKRSAHARAAAQSGVPAPASPYPLPKKTRPSTARRKAVRYRENFSGAQYA